MKTSEVEGVLQGLMDWQVFCDKYNAAKVRFFLRKDGVATSGDLGLKFDTDHFVVTKKQVKSLCKSVLGGKTSSKDAEFLATIVLLCGFDFDGDSTEDALLMLSSQSSEKPGEIWSVLQMLNG